MKLKNKNITLMIATAIFLFSGIFGAVQADENGEEQKLQKVEIQNNTPYYVSLTIRDTYMEVKDIDTAMAPGETKTFSATAFPVKYAFVLKALSASEGKSIWFELVRKNLFGKNIGPEVVQIYVVREDFVTKGRVDVLAKKEGDMLKININFDYLEKDSSDL